MNDLKRKTPSWWDDLRVPADIRPAHLFSWLDEVAPQPEEHDYVLSTDGSGCIKGWGASAAIIQKVVPGGAFGRVLDKYQPIFSGTYGSTVQRREFSAFLDGLHEILRLEMDEAPTDTEDNGEPKLDRRLHFTMDGRITVLWYTDRSNLAKSLLFNDEGVVLNRRTSEVDLWLRYSSIARFFCITPMWTDRNKIPAQKACDAICGLARTAMMQMTPQVEALIGHTIHETWNKKRPQKATF